MEPAIAEPRWTKPVLVLRGGSFRVLRGDGSFECTVPQGAAEGLCDWRVATGARGAASPNSMCVLGGFKEPFTFLHTSDLHLVGRLPDGRVGDRSAVAEELVDAVNSLRPEFVINTGDLISRYGENPRDVLPRDSVERQARRAKEILLRLEVPMFVTPGNHDVAFSWCREAWTEQMGGPAGGRTDDYSFDYGGYHFAALDGGAEYDERTLEPTRMDFSDEQLSWLADDMKRAVGSRLRFLFTHYDYTGRLCELLDELRVDMVMYGHSSPVAYERSDGAVFVNGHLPGTRAYQLVTVDGGRISIEAGPLYRELAG